MVKYGIQLALSKGNYVSAKTCSKEDSPFNCVICQKELSLRAGSKTPKHFIHKKKSSCEGNNDGHREQAELIGSTDENQDEVAEKEPGQVFSSIGSINENQDQNSSTEPEEGLSNGSIDENEDKISDVEPMDDICDESIDQVLSELIPVGSLIEPAVEEEETDVTDVTDDPDDPDVPDIDEEKEATPSFAEDVSNEIIEEALRVVDEIIEPHKCCQCKSTGSDFHQMFTDETREKYGLNDLYVCSNPTCFVECPHCSMPNSQKRHKRTPMCFACDFIGSEWKEEAVEAVKKMTPIPEAPTWLTGRRAIMVIKMLARKRKARIVYNFMVQNKDRTPEFKNKVREQMKAFKIAKAINKVRRASEKNRIRNQKRREAAIGTEGASRYKAMYNNKIDTCACGKQNKRRYMVQYESVMGSMKYACRGCVKTCSGCSKDTIQHDMDRFGNQCFSCYAWKCTRSDEWKTNQKAVLDACMKGETWAMGVLYLNAPGVTKGKYAGDSICHVPSGDLDSVVRRDEPSVREIADVIKMVRKM